jgi:hypothetical protein
VNALFISPDIHYKTDDGIIGAVNDINGNVEPND